MINPGWKRVFHFGVMPLCGVTSIRRINLLQNGISHQHVLSYNPKDKIYAPVSGKIIPLEEVEDAVFSQKIMGDGVGIEPVEGYLYAPVDGKISVVFPTGHVIGIESEDGAGIIMHVGIDTVELKGNGFEVFVEQGRKVKAGELLMKFDLSLIREKYKATVMVVVENSDTFTCQTTKSENVKAGEELLKLERV